MFGNVAAVVVVVLGIVSVLQKSAIALSSHWEEGEDLALFSFSVLWSYSRSFRSWFWSCQKSAIAHVKSGKGWT